MDEVLRQIAEDNDNDCRASLHMLHDFMRWRQRQINFQDERMEKSSAMEQYNYFKVDKNKVQDERMYSNL